MKRKLPEKFFEQNQRAKTRKWKFFNLNQTLWGAGNREFRLGAPNLNLQQDAAGGFFTFFCRIHSTAICLHGFAGT